MCTQQPLQDMLQVLKAYTHTHTLQVWNHLLENCTPTAYSMQICDRQAYRPPQSYDVPARLQCSKNFAAFAHSSTHHSRSREGPRLHNSHLFMGKISTPVLCGVEYILIMHDTLENAETLQR